MKNNLILNCLISQVLDLLGDCKKCLDYIYIAIKLKLMGFPGDAGLSHKFGIGLHSVEFSLQATNLLILAKINFWRTFPKFTKRDDLLTTLLGS